jgi:hypothetical protein
METQIINNWNEFIDVTVSLDGWAFRGHRDAKWPLFSSLSRYLLDFVPDKNEWQEREQRAIRVFRRKAHNYINDPRILEDDLRCLSLMQHHGAPTRLLDFTKSPYVAAFFALEGATDEAAVYALNTPVLWNIHPEDGPDFTHDKINPSENRNFERYYFSGTNEFIWTGEPNQMDRRLMAQSGTFVVPGVIDRPIEGILSHYSSSQTLLKKLILPSKSIRTEGMRSLYRANITNATLFPDLDGLARSIAFELEIVWQRLITG